MKQMDAQGSRKHMNLRAPYQLRTKPVVTAHRGFSGRYPENTLVAFKQAVELGVDVVDFDVRESCDGQLVIVHDSMLDRTSSESRWKRRCVRMRD